MGSKYLGETVILVFTGKKGLGVGGWGAVVCLSRVFICMCVFVYVCMCVRVGFRVYACVYVC